MIAVHNVSYVYNPNDRDKRFCALNDLNFTIKDGEFVSIIGHSGCGKSTLLKIFAGLFLPTEGEIQIDGEKLQGPDTRRAVVFQDYSLFPWMTALKNVMFGIRQARKNGRREERAMGQPRKIGRPANCDMSRSHKTDRPADRDMRPAERGNTKEEIRRTAMEYLEKVNMSEVAEQYPFQLSGGMRQRVAIARALAMNPDILLLDEPFGALDARNRRELQDMMLALRQEESGKKTVVFVTHDIEEAILLSDRILFMRPGEIIADCPVPLGFDGKDRDQWLGSAEYQNLKTKLLGLFYLDDSREGRNGEETQIYETGM